MKKSLMVVCGALALGAFAEPGVPAPGCPLNGAPDAAFAKPERPQMPGGFPMPTMFTIDGNTTPDQIKELKKQFNDKVDAAFAAQAAKTGDDKKPTTVVYLINEGGFGFGGMGMGPQGFGGRRGPGGRGPGMAPNGQGMAPNMMPPPAPAQ